MSDQQQPQGGGKPNRRFIGKVKQQHTQYGIMETIYMDNMNPQNADGTPNKFYKGALIWVDAETGKQYMVKQLGNVTPREGMSQANIAKGFRCFVTIDVDSEYQVTELT